MKSTTQRLFKAKVKGLGAKREKARSHGPPTLPRDGESPALTGRKVHWSVLMFLVALVVPWTIYAGNLRMSIYRAVLLVMLLPCLRMWLTGTAGTIKIADIALLSYAFWSTISLFLHHGFGTSVQPAGIGIIETVCPYLLARCYVRTADDFHNVFKLLFNVVLVLFPFAAFEFVTGKNIWRDMFTVVFPAHVDTYMPPRSGLTRVMTGFDHPILFGLCIGSILAPTYLVLGYRRAFLRRTFATGIVALLSMMSLSAGPMIGLFLQVALLAWNDLFRAVRIRWQLLIGLMFLMWLAVEMFANRSLLNIFVSFFLFEPGSYWYRMFIWQYGSQSVLRHPFFGIGLNDWERPAWMTPSIDNFWLILGVSWGLPAPLLLLLSMLSIILGLIARRLLDDRTSACRTAYVVGLAAFFTVGWTVHFWGAAYVLFLFFLGAGVWMLDAEPASERADRGRASDQRSARSVGPRAV